MHFFDEFHLQTHTWTRIANLPSQSVLEVLVKIPEGAKLAPNHPLPHTRNGWSFLPQRWDASKTGRVSLKKIVSMLVFELVGGTSMDYPINLIRCWKGTTLEITSPQLLKPVH